MSGLLLTRETISEYYQYPLAEAAKKLGLCTTVMKKKCRSIGVKRWPHRRLKSLESQIERTQMLLANKSTKRPQLEKRLVKLQALRDSVLQSFSDPELEERFVREKETEYLKQVSSTVIWHGCEVTERGLIEKQNQWESELTTSPTLPKSQKPLEEFELSGQLKPQPLESPVFIPSFTSLPPMAQFVNQAEFPPPEPAWFQGDREMYTKLTVL